MPGAVPHRPPYLREALEHFLREGSGIALVLPRTREQLAAAGVTRYLFKPFRIPELLANVRRHLLD